MGVADQGEDADGGAMDRVVAVARLCGGEVGVGGGEAGLVRGERADGEDVGGGGGGEEREGGVVCGAGRGDGARIVMQRCGCGVVRRESHHVCCTRWRHERQRGCDEFGQMRAQTWYMRAEV